MDVFAELTDGADSIRQMVQTVRASPSGFVDDAKRYDALYLPREEVAGFSKDPNGYWEEDASLRRNSSTHPRASKIISATAQPCRNHILA
jgi:hypothetical protein